MKCILNIYFLLSFQASYLVISIHSNEDNITLIIIISCLSETREKEIVNEKKNKIFIIIGICLDFFSFLLRNMILITFDFNQRMVNFYSIFFFYLYVRKKSCFILT